MENNGHPQTHHPHIQQRPNIKKRKYRKLFIILIIALTTLGLTWQQTVINSQNNEINNLKKTQLPQKKFADYLECVESDGVVFEIVNNASGCLSGDINNIDKPTYKAFLRFNASVLPRILERQKAPNKNVVVNNVGASKNLVEFLENDYWGCPINGVYEITKEVRDRFALMKYECTDDERIASSNAPLIIGIKLGDGWSLISSANDSLNITGQPSCLLVDMFKVSKALFSKCVETSDYDLGNIKDVTYP